MSKKLAELLRKAREVALYRGHKPPRVATHEEVASDPDFNSLMNNVGPAQDVMDMAIRRIAERTARDIEEQVMAEPRSYAQCADCGARAVARRGGIALCAEHLAAMGPGRLTPDGQEMSRVSAMTRVDLNPRDAMHACPRCGAARATLTRGIIGERIYACMQCGTATMLPP